MKKEGNKKPQLHKDLDGFDIKIDPFGQIQTTFDIESINAFLNQNVEDKKLIHREDWDKDKDDSSTTEKDV